ncbi:hypothetical protein ACET3Z_015199 [Daucus carota]
MKKAITSMQGYLEKIGHLTKLDPQEAWPPITEARNGNAYYAAFHTLSSGIRVQALVLPLAFTSLDRIWGVACLTWVFVWQLYILWLLTQLHNVGVCVAFNGCFRMTLLLGPPSSEKTTLIMLALARKLDPTLKIFGRVTCSGHSMKEFVPQRTAVELDRTMKCWQSATESREANVVTDYVLKILGLDICTDIMVGDLMIRGISGGQKKRVTTGEMLAGPSKTLFMDELSTGLDSSTTS